MKKKEIEVRDEAGKLVCMLKYIDGELYVVTKTGQLFPKIKLTDLVALSQQFSQAG